MNLLNPTSSIASSETSLVVYTRQLTNILLFFRVACKEMLLLGYSIQTQGFTIRTLIASNYFDLSTFAPYCY